MKFSRLIEKAEKFGDKVKQGRQVKPKKLAELQRLLSDKIARYEARLQEDMTEQKRNKLETRLKVVRAQLQKSKQLKATN
jgi:predicted component of type VI protein secretion system